MSEQRCKRFRKKPVVIEAVQVWANDIQWPENVRFDENLGGFAVYDKLHDTWVKFESGDWIITGIYGEKYPCKPKVFAATYEPAEPAASPEGQTYCEARYYDDHGTYCTLPFGHDGRHENWLNGVMVICWVGPPWPVAAQPAQPPSSLIPHSYISTACQHGLHDKCRQHCKFCNQHCLCNCHGVW